MEKKLQDLINTNMFEHIVLHGKRGIFTQELLKIGENIWKAAQDDILKKLDEFQENEQLIIITKKDWENLKKLNKTDKKHINLNQKFKEFISL